MMEIRCKICKSRHGYDLLPEFLTFPVWFISKHGHKSFQCFDSCHVYFLWVHFWRLSWWKQLGWRELLNTSPNHLHWSEWSMYRKIIWWTGLTSEANEWKKHKRTQWRNAVNFFGVLFQSTVVDIWESENESYFKCVEHADGPQGLYVYIVGTRETHINSYLKHPLG